MKKTYQGSCHCGNVRFECELALIAVMRIFGNVSL